MLHSKLKLKSLGLFALTLSLMFLTVGTAQALPAWMVSGKDMAESLSPTVKTSLENGSASLLTTILGIPTKILCKEKHVSVTGGFPWLISITVTWLGCAVYLNGSATASAPCLPKTAGVNDVIGSNKLSAVIALPLANVPEVLVKPSEEGKPLAVVESSEECAVGQKINLTGELFLKDCENKLAQELVTHLFEVDNTHSTMKAAGQAATIDGSENWSLSGAHSGLKWSGLAA